MLALKDMKLFYTSPKVGVFLYYSIYTCFDGLNELRVLIQLIIINKILSLHKRFRYYKYHNIIVGKILPLICVIENPLLVSQNLIFLFLVLIFSSVFFSLFIIFGILWDISSIISLTPRNNFDCAQNYYDFSLHWRKKYITIKFFWYEKSCIEWGFSDENFHFNRDYDVIILNVKEINDNYFEINWILINVNWIQKTFLNNTYHLRNKFTKFTKFAKFAKFTIHRID
jgi:hypothetical protein